MPLVWSVTLAIWHHCCFLKSDSHLTLHHRLVAALLDAILLLSSIAICTFAAYANASNPVSQGNAHACIPLPKLLLSFLILLPFSLPPFLPLYASLKDLASLSTPPEREALWRASPNGNSCLPCCLFPFYAKLTHGSDQGFSVFIAEFCPQCILCAQNNVGKPKLLTSQTAHPTPTCPFQHLMMDLFELPPCKDKKYFKTWVEVFPTKTVTARWELPKQLVR